MLPRLPIRQRNHRFAQMKSSIKASFRNEAELCSTFISQLPPGWTAYPETAGFDIVVVRDADGVQIGVEAKLALNAKVLLQATEGFGYWSQGRGPDFRAVLVPFGRAGAEMVALARLLQVTVIEMKSKEAYQALRNTGWRGFRFVDRHVKKFTPELPELGQETWREVWIDQMPLQRLDLPAYVPDVAAGASGPSQLSEWKIKAIKIAVLLEKRGFVTIADFNAIRIHRQRWLQNRWLDLRVVDGVVVRGQYVKGPWLKDLRAAHPVNYGQIEADFEKWKPAEPANVVFLEGGR